MEAGISDTRDGPRPHRMHAGLHRGHHVHVPQAENLCRLLPGRTEGQFLHQRLGHFIRLPVPQPRSWALAGVAFLFGFDGIIYALGFFVGYIALLPVPGQPAAEIRPLHRAGLSCPSGFHSKSARVLGVVGVLFISLFYMAPQMLGRRQGHGDCS